DRKRANCSREPLLYVGVTRPAAFKNIAFRISNQVLGTSTVLPGLTACLSVLYLFRSKRGVIDSSRDKRSRRMGEGGGKGQLPEQREPERVRSRDVEPRLSRICD